MLSLRLFGPIEIYTDDEPLKIDSRKALALLGYLAATGRPVARAALLGLFWADMPEERGRANLSWTLNRLGALLPGLLQADRGNVRLAADQQLLVDLHQFERLAASGNERDWAAAMLLYAGPLMDGLHLTACPEFEHWLLIERERIEQRVTALMQQYVDALEQRGAFADAADALARLLALDPLREEAHRQRMRLLARSGQRTTALAQFESCRRVLADELGLEPERETVALAEAIRAGAVGRVGVSEYRSEESDEQVLASPGRTTTSYLHTPVALIGRQHDLDAVAGLVTNRTCRMVTITGIGGVGKTTLALACAERVVPLFRDGARVIALAAVDAPSLLPAAIAETLGIDTRSHHDPQQAVFDALRGRDLLLVLDNFEQLLDGAEWLAALLAAAPQITLLVTSQERLGLREEWVYDLPGLPVPNGDTLAEVAESAAARLFVQQAQRVRATFALDTSNSAAVSQVCRMVGGHPLALELAAAWVRTLSCAEIARELAAGLGMLASQVRNVPPRHRSVRAAFSQSWARLSDQEQQALAMLSVFPGDFALEAACAVTETDRVHILALVDRSLLTRSNGGRYALHGLVRSFAAEQLGMAETTSAHGRHWAYVGRLLHAEESRLRGADLAALVRLGDESANIRAGWLWAVQHPDTLVEQVLDCLLLFFDTSGAFRAGTELFAQSVALLDNDSRLRGRLLAREGLLLLWLGQYEAARTVFSRSLEIAQAYDDAHETAISTGGLAFTLRWLGNFAQAEPLARAAVQQARTLGNDWLIATALQYLALICRDLGQHAEARAAALECRSLFATFGYRRGIGFALTVLGLVAHDLGDLDEAEVCFEEGLQLCAAVGDPMGTVIADYYLGRLDFIRGRYAPARQRLERGFASSRAIGYQWGVIRAQTLLGALDAAEGDDASARTRLTASVREADAIGAAFLSQEAHARLGELRGEG